MHVPVAEHPSARPPTVQSTHPEPMVPHLVPDAGMHAVPEQQPEGHEAAVHAHAPATQAWPVAHGAPAPHAQAPAVQRSACESHAVHAAPDVPHALAVGGAVQTAPAQHPEAHVAELHPAQTPAEQTCAPGHAAHALPPVPHAPLAVPS